MAAEWHGFEVKVPGEDFLESTRGILETLVTYLEVVKAILETIQIFLVDFGNPIRALVKALLLLIQQLLDSLRQTGLFAYFDIPNPSNDSNLRMNAGGYPAFIRRFKASLFDGRDPNRPQPTPGITKSGFVLIVADSATVMGLIKLLKVLTRFFGKDFLSPKYPPPANLKVVQVGSKGDRLLRVTSVFTDPPKKLSVEWSLPTTVNQPDPSFEGLVTAAGVEFIPPTFLIERTTVSGGIPLEVEIDTNFEDKNGVPVKTRVPALDDNRDPFRLFEKYIVIDPSHSAGSFFAGQLGTFRYIDDDVVEGKTYFYRVRTFQGALGIRSDGTLDLNTSGNLVLDFIEDIPTGQVTVSWPGSDASNPPIVGLPTTIVAGRLPKIGTNFDVLAVLEALFKTAFALGFHEPLAKGSVFTPAGDPDPSTPASEVGRGSMQDLAGPLQAFVPVVPSGTPPKDVITGHYPELPFQATTVKFYAAATAQKVASQMLGVTGIDALGGFQNLMQGPLPYALSAPVGYVKGSTNIQQLALGYTHTRAGFPEVFDATVYETFAWGFTDVAFRKNILAAISYVKTFATNGTAHDWVSVSILRDIIPWSGQLLYELSNRIDSLLEAFKGAEEEIKDFIATLIRKIEVLERFLKFLITILNYLDSFNAEFSILKVPETSGGIADWVEQIDTSTGDKPKSGIQGYTGGVCLAYVGPDITAFRTAFSLLF